MKIVVQRVLGAKLKVSNKIVSQINLGLVVLIGVDKLDSMTNLEYLAKKVAGLRIFKDENEKLNLSVKDVNGEILLVSNFTLNAEISSGFRPSFSNSADKDKALDYYLKFKDMLEKNGVKEVKMGVFGENMQIETQLFGPVTIVLEKK